MKMRWTKVLILFIAVFLLSGCRIRVVMDPALADQKLRELSTPISSSEPEMPPDTTEPTAPEENTSAPETTVPVETAPPPTAPPSTRPPESSEPPTVTNPPESARPSAPVETVAPTQPIQPVPGPNVDPSGTQTDESGGENDDSAETPTDDPNAPLFPDIIEEEETDATEALEETLAVGLTVTFDPNGGESGTVTTVVTRGETYGVLPRPEWRGRSFLGWWTDPADGDPITSETVVTAQTDHRLYAHWSEPAGIILNFDGNGGRVKSRDSRLELKIGEPIGEMPVPVREGYNFIGWWTEPEGGAVLTPETSFETDGERTVYAHWEYDPLAFWTFTLQNKTQQIYLCQQSPVYLETADHTTQMICPLITDTGSYNIAAYLETPETTDDWVMAKNPAVIIKCVSSMAEAETVRAAAALRFPDKPVLIARQDALNAGPAGLYARIALAKYLYGDWYTDVDLTVVAAELGLTEIPLF